MDSTRFTIEVALKRQPRRYENPVTDYGQFYIIALTRGELRFSDKRTSALLTAGRMVVLRRGSTFRLTTDASGYAGIAVEAIPADQAEFHGMSFATASSAQIGTIANWIEAELELPQPHSGDFVEQLGRSLVSLALREAAGTTWGPEAGDPQEALAQYWARRAQQAIANAVYTTQSVQEILQPFPLSYRQLSRYVKREIGATPKHIQLEAKMRQARRLLTETSWSVTTIALEIGFSSAQHFSTVFGTRHESPPARWRADNRVLARS